MTAIVVVTYNSSSVIERCLDGLADTRVIVADNASSDDTLDRVRRYANAQVIPVPRNMGFGTAANIAIRAANDDVLLLNPDVVADREGIAALAGTLIRHRRAGILAPQLQYPSGQRQSSARTFPSPMTMLLRRTPLGQSRIGAARLARHLYPVESPGEVPVDWVLGAAMFIRRRAFDEIGGFDERFFLYGEDVDLCYRMWAAGWEVRLAGDVTLRHEYGRQSAHTLDFRERATRAHWRSVIRLFAKHPRLLIGGKPRRRNEASFAG